MRQGQHRLGLPPGLGQRIGQLGLGELLPDQRHLRRTCQGSTRLGTAPDELGDRGVLERARGGLGPVQPADDPGQLILGRGGEPGAVPGRVHGLPEHHRAARRGIQQLPGAERADRTGRLTRHPARRTGLTRTAASPLYKPGTLTGTGPLTCTSFLAGAGPLAGTAPLAGAGSAAAAGPLSATGTRPGSARPHGVIEAGIVLGVLTVLGGRLFGLDRGQPRHPLLLGQPVFTGRGKLPPALTGELIRGAPAAGPGPAGPGPAGRGPAGLARAPGGVLVPPGVWGNRS